MASKFYKAYKFVVGGKSRPGIVGVKPKSGGVVDEFKSRKLKQLGKTQRKLESQDKAIGTEMSKARDRGATRKDLVKGRKFQKEIRRTKREGDKLRKDVLRIGKKEGGKVTPDDIKRGPGSKSPGRPGRGREDAQPRRPKNQRPLPPSRRPGLERLKPKPGMPVKRKEMKEGGKALKPVDKKKNPGLAKLPTHVRNKMGYMKDGGKVKKKFPDLTGDGKVTKADILKGRGVFGAGGGVRGSSKSSDIYSRIKQRERLKQIRKKFGGGKR